MRLTNRDLLESLPRAELIRLLDIYAEQLMLMDGLWFSGCQQRLGPEPALAMDLEVWRRYGKREARKLMRFLGLERTDSLEQAARLMVLSPMFGPFGGQAEVEGNSCRVEVTDCRPQKARLAAGQGELPCKEVGAGYMEAFLAELGPDWGFECNFCPPDPHPKDLWCSWRVMRTGG